jgi:hypothetical protein
MDDDLFHSMSHLFYIFRLGKRVRLMELGSLILELVRRFDGPSASLGCAEVG